MEHAVEGEYDGLSIPTLLRRAVKRPIACYMRLSGRIGVGKSNAREKY